MIYLFRLLLGDVFENFRSKLDPAHFLLAAGLAWKAFLKKDRSKLELWTDIDMVVNGWKRYKGLYNSCNT